MAYQPIESYGVIGDMHSAALVCENGSIDWCCLPHFDSPSVFAAILDDEDGGRFQITALPDVRIRQMYLPDTNVLLTRFLSGEGAAEILDFMPIRNRPDGEEESSAHQIVRIARAVRGKTTFRLTCKPAYDFGRSSPEVHLSERGAVFETSGPKLALVSPVPLERTDGGVWAEFCLQAGESRTFVFRCCADGQGGAALLEQPFDGEAELDHTIAYWRRWLSRSRYEGRWRSMVERSALALKLLTFRPTGAIVAAPTTSLPGEIGGERNFDYRYTWVRDAAFTVYAFLRLGFVEEAERFVHWVHERVRESDSGEPLQVLYGIDGRHKIEEETLTHLDGYRGSRPVRLGNQAAGQLQLDIYGAVIDAVYLYDKHVDGLPWEVWRNLRSILHWVADNWEREDDGIWEVRADRQHFVYSKVQCWVALDRGIRMARKKGLPLELGPLEEQHRRIYEQVMQKGWNQERGAFVQHYGSDALDAANLLMPLMKFVTPNDPRMLATIQRTRDDLVEDSLVYRYRIGAAAPDGLEGREGSFSVCTFWLVEAMTRAGLLQDARFIFEKMAGYANHLGLFSEEIGLRGEALGNFPQAYTHLGLISAAFSLDRALSR